MKIKKKDDSLILKESRKLQDELDDIHRKAVSIIFGKLSSLARQIDSGSKTLKEFANDLNSSKSDNENSDSKKTHPSPFLLKYVDGVLNNADNLSQSIAAYSSHLQPQSNTSVSSSDQNNNHENNVLYNFLKEQNDAISRCSTKVSQLTIKMDGVRSELSKKLNINTTYLTTDEKSTDISNVQSIKTKYQQFLEQKELKEKKRQDESDIFGNSTVTVQASGGLLKSGLNLGINSKGFGKKDQSQSSITKTPGKP